jgi:hypothetical protein
MQHTRPRSALALLVAAGAACGGASNVSPAAAVGPDDGGARPTVTAGPLSFRATTALDAQRVFGAEAEPVVITRAVIRNDGPLAAALEYGVCNVTLLAHRTADRSGPPAWRSDRARPWEGTYGRGCPQPLIMAQLAPGDSVFREFEERTRLVELLGDSLPDGRYWFTAQVRLIAPRLVRDVEAGALDLSLARPPMPTERTYEFMTYRAAGAPRAGGARVTVTATLTHAGGSLVTYPRDCVVRVLAFRDRARRDAAPRSGAADWRQPLDGCAGGTTQLTLSGGESRTFTADAALPPGRYYLAAVVRAEGRDLYLSAGEVDVAR